MKANLNDWITIYPSEMGWMLINGPHVRGETITKDGVAGYRIQLWQLIHDHSDLFYHGTKCLETMKVDIETKKL
jgi:hypothetical protein